MSIFTASPGVSCVQKETDNKASKIHCVKYWRFFRKLGSTYLKVSICFREVSISFPFATRAKQRSSRDLPNISFLGGRCVEHTCFPKKNQAHLIQHVLELATSRRRTICLRGKVSFRALENNYLKVSYTVSSCSLMMCCFKYRKKRKVNGPSIYKWLKMLTETAIFVLNSWGRCFRQIKTFLGGLWTDLIWTPEGKR